MDARVILAGKPFTLLWLFRDRWPRSNAELDAAATLNALLPYVHAAV